MTTNIEVSIIIVCMNNIKNLYPCLDSIKKYTNIMYETIIVAYLFSNENLTDVRQKYPWIILIESNEIRGFSENNNLALRRARGKYCFVLNDDTELSMPVIDSLVDNIKKLSKRAAIISPQIIYPNGKIQACGIPLMNWKTYILDLFHLWRKKNKINTHGIFKTYNILGAAFLIKTDVFRKYNWFNETYFFSPEDIALSTLLNKEGYECYVNPNVNIIHKGGMSGKSLSPIQIATRPAQCKGEIIFYSENSYSKYIILSSVTFTIYCLRYIYHVIKGHLQKKPNVNYILSKGDLNCIKECFSSKTPKDIFIKYYYKLNNQI